MRQNNDNPIIGILAGPTASGKSSMAVEIARRHPLSIISGDSMQVYRGMEIGTGAISDTDRCGVPHHLLGVADPSEDYHAAKFCAAANEIAQREWQDHGRRSLVAGGSGMWLQALREGLFEGPGRDEAIRSELRQVLENQGPEALHLELSRVDPAMAERLSPRDHVRVLRAIEIFRLSGKTQSAWHEEDRQRRAQISTLLPLVVITHQRDELARRIDSRVDQMIAAGWLEEARRLHEKNLPQHSPARKALGFRELFDVIDGRLTLPDAISQIKIATRQYAKRQMTWFRAQRDVIIIQPPDPAKVESALQLH